MTLPIEYIKIPACILGRTDLSDKAKMLLGLIAGFDANGLMLSNPQLAAVLGTHQNYIPRLLNEIKNDIQIENPQSRYRRIFYLNQTVTVEADTLKQNVLSSDPLLKHTGKLLKPFDTATLTKRLDINKETKEKNINIICDKESQRFIKPALQEIEDYAASIGFTLDAHSFLDYYEARGWMIGKSRMKDWRAAVRTWKRNQDSYSKKERLPRITTEVKNDGQYKTINA